MDGKKFEGGENYLSTIEREREKVEKRDLHLERFGYLKEELEEVETNPFDPEEEHEEYKAWKLTHKEKVEEIENKIFVIGHPEEKAIKLDIEINQGRQRAEDMLEKSKTGKFTGIKEYYKQRPEILRLEDKKKYKELKKKITENFLRAIDDFLKDRLEKLEAETNPFDSDKQPKEYKRWRPNRKRIMRFESEIYKNGDEYKNGEELKSGKLSESFLVEKHEFFEKQLKKVMTNPYDPIEESKFFDKWKGDNERIKLLRHYEADTGISR